MAIRNQNEKSGLFQKGRVRVSRCQGGFTYIGVLVLVALMGMALAAVGQVWHIMAQREKEQELLFIGHEFRLALMRYAQNAPGPAERSPLHLEDLLKDPRAPGVRRYLRKIYLDPMTGSADWGLITGPNGEIYGVHSLSDAEPLKKANFALADRQFEGKTKYSEWIFIGTPGTLRRHLPTAPAGSAAGSGA